MKFKLAYSKKLTDLNPIKFNLLKNFVKYCIDFLSLKSDFSVFLVDKNHGIDMTLACFNLETNDIHIRYEDRFVYDVCRSIAHELVHLQQKELGKLDDLSGYTDAGGNIEDEANAVAGVICKMYVKENNADWIYKL